MRQLSGPQLLARHADRGANAAAPLLLLDVREAWEVALAPLHLAGWRTLHIPMGELAQRLPELDAAQPVVCICHHGVRSAQVVAFLQRRGFEAAYNLAGGVDAWSAQVDPAVARY